MRTKVTAGVQRRTKDALEMISHAERAIQGVNSKLSPEEAKTAKVYEQRLAALKKMQGRTNLLLKVIPKVLH